jgi:pantothenate kinase
MNAQGRMPGSQQRWRDDWLRQITLFNDDVGVVGRHDDFASRALAHDEQQAHWFRGTCAPVAKSNGRRQIIAIVGAPGSGKSTLAEQLISRLNENVEGCAALLPMDGYHYDDRVLIERGLRARKGTPETFDVIGLVHMLDRLRRDEEDEIAVPVFDCDLEISRAGARLIPRAVRALIVEGNYLLLDQEPWSCLRAMFDVTVAIDEPEDILRKRLIERWQSYGLTPPEIAGIRRKLHGCRAGSPDFWIIHAGATIGIELKSRVGRVSPVQKKIRREMVAAGGSWFMCRSVRAALAVLHQQGVPLRDRQGRLWRPPDLPAWEEPVSDPEQRLVWHPAVKRRWREDRRRQRARQRALRSQARNLRRRSSTTARARREGLDPRRPEPNVCAALARAVAMVRQQHSETLQPTSAVRRSGGPTAATLDT